MIKRWPFTTWALFALVISLGLRSADTFGYPRNLLMEFLAPWQAVWAFMFWLPKELLSILNDG